MSSAEICTWIVKCLGEFWSKKQLLDFTVKIDDVSIECHRFILEACSDYFEALFRSGMREATENCVVLQDVSVTVFELILNTLYTGVNSLTLDNFIEVWQAVHRLQIRFMVTCCENFAIDSISIETWENIYKTAKLIESENVLEKLYLFMLKNFEQICRTPTFLKLQCNEIRDLIKSQDLVVGREEIVLDSVIKWVDHVEDINTNQDLANRPGNNKVLNENNVSENKIDSSHLKDENSDTSKERACLELHTLHSDQNSLSTRKESLNELLKLVRTCLVNPAVLSRVYKLKLISENEEARNIIFNASLYHAIDYRHGQWHSAAIHRHCSEYYHCGVYARSNGYFRALNSENNTKYDISKCGFLERHIQLVAFGNELYATGADMENYYTTRNRMCVLCDGTWTEIVQIPSWNLILISYGYFIFIFNKDDKIIYTVKPKLKSTTLEKFTNFPDEVDVEHAMVFEDWILVFASVVQNGVDETAVYKLDMCSKTWSRLDTLDGPAKQLISFRNDRDSYILQTNGNLWTVKYQLALSNFDFKLIAKLWDFEKKLFGALTYNDKVIIFGNNPNNKPPNGKQLLRVEGQFNIQHWGINDDCSNFIPITLQKKFLLPGN